jgi:hypothetical protein
MLERASAAGDSQGIADAVSLFEEVMSVCSRGPHVEYWKSVVNLADALIKQSEADGSDGPLTVRLISSMLTRSISALAVGVTEFVRLRTEVSRLVRSRDESVAR